MFMENFNLTSDQKDLLTGVCEFYGFRQYIFYVFTKKSLIKALDAIIGELEFKLINSQVRYHSVLATDIEALQMLYSQIV